MSSILFPFNDSSPDIFKLSDIKRPDKKFNKVVFPDPDGPNIAVKWAGFITPFKLLSKHFSVDY